MVKDVENWHGLQTTNLKNLGWTFREGQTANVCVGGKTVNASRAKKRLLRRQISLARESRQLLKAMQFPVCRFMSQHDREKRLAEQREVTANTDESK